MSIRAYKLIEVKTAKEPTFNCWNDEKIFDIANLDEYGEDGGKITLCRVDVEQLLKDKDLTENEIEKLNNILKDMGEENYVEYYCF